MLAEERVGEPTDRRQIRQVDNAGIEVPARDELAEGRDALGGSLRVTGRHADQGTPGGHRAGTLPAKAAGRACDHDTSTG